MNILYITPSLPSRLHRVRAVNIMKYLSRTHDVHLVTLANDKQPDFELDEVRSFCTSVNVVRMSMLRSWAQCALFLPTPLPLEVSFTRNRAMNVLVRKIVKEQNIDLIYVKRLRAAQFVDSDIDLPTVIDSTDAMSLYYDRARKGVGGIQRLIFEEELIKYRSYEKRIAKRFKHWIACSPIDQAYLAGRFPDIDVTVIPNGVDLEYYIDNSAQSATKSIVFSGLMDKYVNISAATYFHRNVYPGVKDAIPTVKLSIFGPRPSMVVKNLASDPSVEVRGFVSDLRPQILKHAVVVCPILVGTGTRNKILQAWALGRPVVSTPQGASGLDVEHGKNILIAETPQDFTKHVIDVLNDPELQQKLVDGGKKIVMEKYSMGTVISQLNIYLEGVVA